MAKTPVTTPSPTVSTPAPASPWAKPVTAGIRQVPTPPSTVTTEQEIQQIRDILAFYEKRLAVKIAELASKVTPA